MITGLKEQQRTLSRPDITQLQSEKQVVEGKEVDQGTESLKHERQEKIKSSQPERSKVDDKISKTEKKGTKRSPEEKSDSSVETMKPSEENIKHSSSNSSSQRIQNSNSPTNGSIFSSTSNSPSKGSINHSPNSPSNGGIYSSSSAGPISPSPSSLTKLGKSRMHGNYDEIQRVGSFLRRGSLAGFILWLVLLALIFAVAPADSYEHLEGPERHANIIVIVLLAITNGSRLLPLLIKDKSVFATGTLVGSCTVQGIAFMSIAIMLAFPTPVMMDEVTGRRVHMVRWAEWTPCAFLMTFLTEGIDLGGIAVSGNAERIAWYHAISLGASTIAGGIFPFCHTLKSWLLVFGASCVLFCDLYLRLFQRTQRFRGTKKGTSVDEQEHYDRVRLSLRLVQACSIVWTLLVVAWTACCFTSILAPPDSVWASPWLPLVTESICEVLSKVWYLVLIIEAHDLVFDENASAVRRLEELRDMMSIVWGGSSDVIVICGRAKGGINAIVSPTFLNRKINDSDIALMYHVRPPDDTLSSNKTPEYSVFPVNMTQPFTQVNMKKNILNVNFDSTDQCNIESISRLICKTWQHSDTEESLVLHDMYGGTYNENHEAVPWEAKITRLDSNSAVAVLRDVGERVRRFEAEKKLIKEVTERQKDAEANRFTRHEVKNGLLAAIGLVDTLRDVVGHDSADQAPPLLLEDHRRCQQATVTFDLNQNQNASRRSASSTKTSKTLDSTNNSLASSDEHGIGIRTTADLANTVRELDDTLQEVLDTILSEAMAREVAHEVYEPKLERINVATVLYGTRKPNVAFSERFPLHSVPSPFPDIQLDPQLLRYIHRNAVSNACKYGLSGGQVRTELFFDAQKNSFRMDVINLPGDGHENLVKMSDEEVQTVFSAGTRLHKSDSSAAFASLPLVSTSAGDGAWIMQRCARTLGGSCTIKFEPERTRFSLVCPAKAYSPEAGVRCSQKKITFRLPENTWGIAIDDSGIQRKLMDRFLSLTGVHNTRKAVMGKDENEILQFNDFLLDKIRKHPDDKFLVIVDENLDILDGGSHQRTVSGSMCVELLRQRMNPTEESRMLALVRSANDSREDIALYKSRAHGFLPKAPIKKDRVLEMIQPWWAERFPTDDSTSLTESGKESDEDEGLQVSSGDLIPTLEVIDALIAGADDAALAARWPTIRDRIHGLKGDLKSMTNSARASTIVEAMDKLKGKSVPHELPERWKLIKSLILSML